jgi:hypothetical protein
MLTKILPREVLVPQLLALIDSVAEIDKLSDMAISQVATGGPNTIYYLRLGRGVNYDTMQKLNTWVLNRRNEIENGIGVITVIAKEK